MSTATTVESQASLTEGPTYHTTTLAESMLLLALLTVFQRGIGFVRATITRCAGTSSRSRMVELVRWPISAVPG